MSCIKCIRNIQAYRAPHLTINIYIYIYLTKEPNPLESGTSTWYIYDFSSRCNYRLHPHKRFASHSSMVWLCFFFFFSLVLLLLPLLFLIFDSSLYTFFCCSLVRCICLCITNTYYVETNFLFHVHSLPIFDSIFFHFVLHPSNISIFGFLIFFFNATLNKQM